ncbi:iron hydrogenase small subunit [Desulfurobacterium thermolithotrophum]
MYKNYLGEIGGEKAHKLLHTTYQRKANWEEILSVV